MLRSGDAADIDEMSLQNKLREIGKTADQGSTVG